MAQNSHPFAAQASRRAPSRDLAPLRALWPFLAPYKGMIAAAGVALLLAASAVLMLPLAARGVIDHGLSAVHAARVGRYSLAPTPAARFL